MFDYKEQRIKDVMNGIEIIRPVITLLRELKEGENERCSKVNTINTVLRDINVLEELDSKVSTDGIRSQLAGIVRKYSEKVSSMEEALKILTNKLMKIREEITQYHEYSNSFYYVSDEAILEALLEIAVKEECSCEDFYLIMLILKNELVDDRSEVNEMAISYSERVQDTLRNYILKNFEQYEFEDIVQLIKES